MKKKKDDVDLTWTVVSGFYVCVKGVPFRGPFKTGESATWFMRGMVNALPAIYRKELLAVIRISGKK